jgi:hypothetical protein
VSNSLAPRPSKSDLQVATAQRRTPRTDRRDEETGEGERGRRREPRTYGHRGRRCGDGRCRLEAPARARAVRTARPGRARRARRPSAGCGQRQADGVEAKGAGEASHEVGLEVGTAGNGAKPVAPAGQERRWLRSFFQLPPPPGRGAERPRSGAGRRSPHRLRSRRRVPPLASSTDARGRGRRGAVRARRSASADGALTDGMGWRRQARPWPPRSTPRWTSSACHDDEVELPGPAGAEGRGVRPAGREPGTDPGAG